MERYFTVWKKYSSGLYLATGLVILAVAVSPFYLQRAQQPPLPVLGQIPDFHLMDSSGIPFEIQELMGKIWVADFIFTTCTGPCPTMSMQMASLHRSYDLEEDIRMVSITVDPEYDTPEIMAEYARRYNANTERWHFLTGDHTEIQNLVINGFKMGATEDLISHSTRFALVDREARIRGYYFGTRDEDIQKLFTDIARLMRERVRT